MSVETTARNCVAVAGTWCGIGLNVPIAPTLIALFAVFTVRLLVWTKGKSITWNVAVLLIAMLAAFVTVEQYQLNAFRAFWFGIGYGGIGVGIIEIGRTVVTGALGDRFKNAAGVLFGINLTKEPKEDA